MNYVDINDQVVNIAQIARRCPTITLARAFGRAYRDWAGQTHYLRVTIQGSTTADTRQYDLGSDAYLDIIGICAAQLSETVNGRTVYRNLAPSDSTTWNSNADGAAPATYCYVPEGQIGLNPTPDAVYSLTVTAIVQPKEGAGQVPEEGLVKWRSGIEAGALANLYEIPGMPWSDPRKVATKRAEFQSCINNARAAVQRAFNTGTVMARPRTILVR